MLHFFALHTNRVFDSSRDFPEAIFFWGNLCRLSNDQLHTKLLLLLISVSFWFLINVGFTLQQHHSRCSADSSFQPLLLLTVRSSWALMRWWWRARDCVLLRCFADSDADGNYQSVFFLLCTLKQPTISRRELWWKTCFDFCIRSFYCTRET